MLITIVFIQEILINFNQSIEYFINPISEHLFNKINKLPSRLNKNMTSHGVFTLDQENTSAVRKNPIFFEGGTSLAVNFLNLG